MPEVVEIALKEYGLTDKEVEVYLALLPLGKVTLQELAKRIELPRTTIYNTLTYLINKGLVSTIKEKNATHFGAVEPHKISDDLKQKSELISKAMPFLENLKKELKESSSTQIFSGFKGIAAILTDVFKIKQETYYFGSYSKSLEVLKHLPEHFRTLRVDNKILAKIIIDPYDKETFHKPEYKKITEMRFLEAIKDFPCIIFIYGKKVAIYTVEGDLIGIIIKNEQVAKAMKIIFDMYWSQAKPARL